MVLHIDNTELTHMVVSVVTISMAFSAGALWAGLPAFFYNFPIVLVTFGLAFVLHELGHKAMAQCFGCWAIYRAWTPGLILALAMALMTAGRFVFAAPGAVYIGGKPVSAREDAYISLAGPLVNIILGVIAISLAVRFVPGSLIHAIFVVSASVNFFLAMFNLLPFPPLDGYKIISWNVPLWLVAIAVPAFFTMF